MPTTPNAARKGTSRHETRSRAGATTARTASSTTAAPPQRSAVSHGAGTPAWRASVETVPLTANRPAAPTVSAEPSGGRDTGPTVATVRPRATYRGSLDGGGVHPDGLPDVPVGVGEADAVHGAVVLRRHPRPPAGRQRPRQQVVGLLPALGRQRVEHGGRLRRVADLGALGEEVGEPVPGQQHHHHLSATTTDVVRSSENCSLKGKPRPL